MTRLTILAFLMVFCTPAYAEALEPNGRYAFIPKEEGFFRLDTRTGEVSVCEADQSGSLCRLAADERMAYQAEIAALEDRILALEGKVLALQTSNKLAEREGEPPASLFQRRRQTWQNDLPSDEDIDQFMDTAEQVMRRFFGFVQDLQDDLEKDTL